MSSTRVWLPREYSQFKEKYETTKPIRGRAEDVRPIGKRNRDWERIVEKRQPDGTVSYACRLYKTDVVEYFEDGSILLSVDRWVSYLTSTFMCNWSPFAAYKHSNHIWVNIGTKEYIVPRNGSLSVKKNDAGAYEAVNPAPMYRNAVERSAMKAVREPFKPFLKWAKAFLSMSDGWIMHETRAEVQKFRNYRYDPYEYVNYFVTLERSQGIVKFVSDEANYLSLLCSLLRKTDALGSQTVEYTAPDTFETGLRFANTRFSYEQLKRKLDKEVKLGMPVYKLVEVPAGPKCLRDIVLK